MKEEPKKDPRDLISEENKMDPEKMKEMEENLGKPIIEMEEDRIMPVYMLMGELVFKTKIGESGMSYMVTISHNKKDGLLETRGRMRYEDTGNKTVFEAKEKYKVIELEKAKDEVRKMYKDMLKDIPSFKEREPYFELEFNINESTDSIVKKMNDSNRFNIGVSEKKD